MSSANSLRSACSGSSSAICTPASTPAIAAEAEEQRGPPAGRCRSALSPGSSDGGREDREQRGRFGMELGEAEDEREGRHEQGSATDAEEPGEHARDQAEGAREESAHIRSGARRRWRRATPRTRARAFGSRGAAEASADDRAERPRKADDGRCARLHLAVQRVAHRPDEARSARPRSTTWPSRAARSSARRGAAAERSRSLRRRRRER